MDAIIEKIIKSSVCLYDKDNKYIFKDFSMDINPGERIGIMGESGKGKTTLMKSMMNQQLESFPTDLKSVFVETDICLIAPSQTTHT